MGWTARVRFPAVQDFSLLHIVQTASRGRAGAKRAGREADHPPPSSAQLKKGRAIPPLHRDKLTFCYQESLIPRDAHSQNVSVISGFVITRGYSSNILRCIRMFSMRIYAASIIWVVTR
jgi:hypothetical protein